MAEQAQPANVPAGPPQDDITEILKSHFLDEHGLKEIAVYTEIPGLVAVLCVTSRPHFYINPNVLYAVQSLPESLGIQWRRIPTIKINSNSGPPDLAALILYDHQKFTEDRAKLAFKEWLARVYKDYNDNETNVDQTAFEPLPIFADYKIAATIVISILTALYIVIS